MEEYKNYLVNGGGLFDWPYSSKFRAMSVVLQVRPSGTTVVIKRFVAQQLFQDSTDAAAYALKRAKAWVDWAEETRAWVGMWIQCFGWPV